MVAVTPLFNPFKPKPFSATICLVTLQVLGISLPVARFACNVTLTTSNGFTNIASVTPAPKPANENVLKQKQSRFVDDLYAFVNVNVMIK